MCGCWGTSAHEGTGHCDCSCHVDKPMLAATKNAPFNAGVIYKDDTILEEAAGLIYGDRMEQYGNAKDNFTDIGGLWEPIIGIPVTAEQVALCLIQLKIARAIRDVREQRPIKRDTIVDLAGYAGCIEKIQKGV